MLILETADLPTPFTPIPIFSIRLRHQNLREATLNGLFSFLSPARGSGIELGFDNASLKL